MTKASPAEPQAFRLSPRVEFVLASAAVAALLLGGWGLFGGAPAPLASVQSAELPAPSLRPKLDHTDALDPTGAFITANALAHVASLKLPPDAVLLPTESKPHVRTVRAPTRRERQIRTPLVAKTVLPRPAVTPAQPTPAAALPPISIATPAVGSRLPLVARLGNLIPTPEKLRRSAVWVGDTVGSLVRRL